MTKLDSLVQHVTTTERLAALIDLSTHQIRMVRRLLRDDDGLSPEIAEAVKHLGEYVEALQRAYKYSVARLEVEFDLQPEEEES